MVMIGKFFVSGLNRHFESRDVKVMNSNEQFKNKLRRPSSVGRALHS